MNPITVSALSTHIVFLFENDELLRDVWVTGEVSNWKRAGSGHVYFSMKDSGSAINAVMWRNSVVSQNWLPQEGDQIIAHGYVGVYPDRGVYQLYVNQIRPAGRGQLYAQFEALKARLQDEGLFAPERKRSIPSTPQRLGIVTSRDAAALRDVLRVLAGRWPVVDVVLFPTLVQGSEAPTQIVDAVRAANRYSSEVEELGAIILARGGGSIEDLWAFNDERVAYAVAESVLPIVTGIGHETDFTIADFVADLRTPTPSAAAAATVPDRSEVRAYLVALVDRTGAQMLEAVQADRRQVDQVQQRLQRLHPSRRVDSERQGLDDRERRLHGAVDRLVTRLVERNAGAHQRLDALSPLAVLQRGYSIVQRVDGEIVVSPRMLSQGEELDVRAAGGEYRVAVQSAYGDSL